MQALGRQANAVIIWVYIRWVSNQLLQVSACCCRSCELLGR